MLSRRKRYRSEATRSSGTMEARRFAERSRKRRLRVCVMSPENSTSLLLWSESASRPLGASSQLASRL